MILPTSTSTVDIQDLTITQVTEGPVTLDTFRQLMSLLAKQRAEIEALQPFADVDTIRVDVKRLQRALLPWPSSRLDEMHRLLPHLAAGMAVALQGPQPHTSAPGGCTHSITI